MSTDMVPDGYWKWLFEPLKVKCPICDAPVGEDCKLSERIAMAFGLPISTPGEYHRPRKELAYGECQVRVEVDDGKAYICSHPIPCNVHRGANPNE